MSDNVLELTQATFDEQVAGGVTLVDFWAPWCGPCRMVAPIVERVAEKTAGRAKVGKLNVDEARDTAAKFDVKQIPTLIVFKDGNAVQQMTGVRQEAELIAAIEDAL
jgi:thioredoxin 1